jgi:hypothetical protein
MGHQPRPSGAPKGSLHNAMPCSCLLISAFLTACHLTTIWAEHLPLCHPAAGRKSHRERWVALSGDTTAAAVPLGRWPLPSPEKVLVIGNSAGVHGSQKRHDYRPGEAGVGAVFTPTSAPGCAPRSSARRRTFLASALAIAAPFGCRRPRTRPSGAIGHLCPELYELPAAHLLPWCLAAVEGSPRQ